MKTKKTQSNFITTKELTKCALFTALIAVGAFIKIPVPVVPFTMQLFFTTMAGLLLGSKLGAISCLAYMLLGLIGVPIFAEGGGLFYVLKPSFGYIIGFAVGAFVTGKIVENVKELTFLKAWIASIAGLFIVYLAGMVYYYVICNYVINQPIALWPVFLYCFLLIVPGDFALCFLAAYLAKRCRGILQTI